jgi:hypothetical protein
MLVRTLYAAVALSILGAFPRDAYRAVDGQPRAAVTAPAVGPAFELLQAPAGAAAPSGTSAASCPTP